MRRLLTVVGLSWGLARAASGAGEAPALQWCEQDTAVPSCVGQYLILAPQCAGGGYRSCLIARARDAALNGDCGHAFTLARLCQCENHDVRDGLEEGAVCDWLRAR